MGRPFLEFLEGDGTDRVYYCRLCHRTVADAKESNIMSRDFHSKYGKAYLVHRAINVSSGPAEDRMMTSGLHTVCDIFCTGCLYNLGWKYLVAHETNQKYKEGKFILERAKIADDAEVEAAVAERKIMQRLQSMRPSGTTTSQAAINMSLSSGSGRSSSDASAATGATMTMSSSLASSGGGGSLLSLSGALMSPSGSPVSPSRMQFSPPGRLLSPSGTHMVALRGPMGEEHRRFVLYTEGS